MHCANRGPTARAVGDDQLTSVAFCVERGHQSVRECTFERRSARGTPWHGLAALGRSRRGAVRLRVHGRQHGISETDDVDREPAEHLAGPSFDIKDAEKNVARLDLAIPTADGEPVGSLQGALGTVCQGQFRSAGHRGRRPHGLAGFASAPAQRRPGRHQRAGDRALPVPNQPKEEVLSPNLTVPETPRLFFGPADRHAGSVTESVEHGQTLDQSQPSILKHSGEDDLRTELRRTGCSFCWAADPTLMDSRRLATAARSAMLVPWGTWRWCS